MRRHLLKVKHISLVNLIAGKEIVKELVADEMTITNVRSELDMILPGRSEREIMLNGYKDMTDRLGEVGAPSKAANLIYSLLMEHK